MMTSAVGSSSSTFQISSRLIVRAIGLLFGIAFLSIYVQYPGLLGCDGVQPIVSLLNNVLSSSPSTYSTWDLFYHVPSVFWFLFSYESAMVDLSAEWICLVGAFLSFFQFFTLCYPSITSIISWILYLSLVKVGAPFLTFQWNILLLESGFLVILLAFSLDQKHTPVIYLIQFLVFKLLFLSGIVKLLRPQTEAWKSLHAMYYHYATQCLPTPLSYYTHQLPSFIHELEVAGTLLLEIPLAILILLPLNSTRRSSAFFQSILQLFIMLTGNYSFFNINTIVLLLSLLEDSFWRQFFCWQTLSKQLPNILGGLFLYLCIAAIVSFFMFSFSWSDREIYPVLHLTLEANTLRALLARYSFHLICMCALFFIWKCLVYFLQESESLFSFLRSCFLVFVCCTIFMQNLDPLLLNTSPSDNIWVKNSVEAKIPEFYSVGRKFQICSSYGLFSSMTGIGILQEVSRPEIILEGLVKGGEWKEMDWMFKPGNLSSALPHIAPHQPHLDWQMWFAALGTYQRNPWFVHMVYKLLVGSPGVYDLLAPSPYFSPLHPPSAIRAKLYMYDFTVPSWGSHEKHRLNMKATEEGTVWRRRLQGNYFPEVTLHLLKQPLQSLYNLNLNAECSIPVSPSWLYWAALEIRNRKMASLLSLCIFFTFPFIIKAISRYTRR